MIYTREIQVEKIPLADTSDDIVELMSVWQDKILPEDLRNEALDFMRNYPPSCRDQIWQNRVHNFLRSVRLFSFKH